MGATVSVGRRVSAFRTSDNKVVYALFERTYEKNCYPHTPHWSCIGIGYAKDAIARIFAYGSGCEGGSLQGRGRDLTPEGYIRSFLKELAAPYPLRDGQFMLQVGEGLYSTVHKEDFEKVESALAAIGRSNVADKLRAGEGVEISLHGDLDIVLAIYGLAGKVASPWRLGLHEPEEYESKLPVLGYENDWEQVKPTAQELPVFYKLGHEERLLQRPDGTLVPVGWAYWVVAQFVERLGESGDIHKYADRIKSFRNLVGLAPSLNPERLKVVCNESAELERWRRMTIDEFKAKYPVTMTESGFEFALSDDSYGDALRLSNIHFEFIDNTPATVVPSQEHLFAVA